MLSITYKQEKQYIATLNKLREISANQSKSTDFSHYPLVFFTLVIIFVEFLNGFVPAVTLVAHLILLQVLVIYVSADWNNPKQRYLIVCAVAPIMRILDLGLPFPELTLVYRTAIQGLGMLIVSTMLIYTLKIDLKSLGFRIKNLPIQIPIALLGLLFGLSFSILIPIKLPLSLHTVPVELFAAEIFIVIALGALEGFVFQGLLLNTLQNVVKDRLSAPIFVAMIYASLFLHTGALPYVALVFGTTLFFNYLTIITRNVIGTCVAYGLINLVVFVIVPMGLIPGIG